VLGLNALPFLKFLHKTGKNTLGLSAKERLMLAEQLIAVILTLEAVYLYTLFLINAGSLWRDEANSVAIALRPGFANMWSALKFDSFPVLHFIAVKLWIILFGSGDMPLRVLGFTVGISIITALWLKPQGYGRKTPLISLFLIGLSPVMIRSFASIRPYGIAAILIIIAFSTVWYAVQKPTVIRIIISAISLTLCIQTLYQAAIFISAIGISAISVALLHKDKKHALSIAIPFCIAGASLLPYISILTAARKWVPAAAATPNAKLLLPGLLNAIQSPAPWHIWLWIAAGALAIIGIIQSLKNINPFEKHCTEEDFQIYCGISLITSVIGFFSFLICIPSFSSQAWHYTPLLVIAIISAEPLIRQLTTENLGKGLLLSIIFISNITTLLPAADNTTMRMTSIDHIASAIKQKAGANDLVVLNPWFLGISFSRYYQGPAAWMTFPDLHEITIHRYDLLMEKMKHPKTTCKNMERILSTLQSGGRVWIVGQAYPLSPKLPIKHLPPAPLPITGWSSLPYLSNWSDQLMHTLSIYARQAYVLPINSDFGYQKINPLEAPGLYIFQGWASQDALQP
jgi:hypothetical protein